MLSFLRMFPALILVLYPALSRIQVAKGEYPPNDICTDATPVEEVINLPFDTTGARFGGRGLCMISPNIWYCYTASCTGEVTISLAGSSYDTMLAVYNGCECFPVAADLIACNDDFGGTYQSQLTFSAIAGNQYLIEVGGYGASQGKGFITISCEGVFGPEKPDLGDAPDSSNYYDKIMSAYPGTPSIQGHFPTVFDDGLDIGPFGPAHKNTQPVAYLGAAITGENEADRGIDEDGENNIMPSLNVANLDGGDDGIVFPLNLPHCGWAKINYSVTIIDPDAPLWVNIWLDWNRDGDWDDTVDCPKGSAPEWAVQNQYLFNLSTGLYQITTPGFLSWHPENGPEQIWMRITLAEQPWTGGSYPGAVGNAGSGPDVMYEIGETEDYFFTPDTTDENCPLCKDLDGNGIVDIQDLVAQVTLWLASCQ